MPHRNPFSFGGAPEDAGSSLTEHENELLDMVAKKVVYWKMTVPAILALETAKPLNYIGSQAMVFFQPIVQAVFSFKDYDSFRMLMEKREGIELLLQRIEHFDAIAHRKERLFKRMKKNYLKSQSFGFRVKSAIIGFKVPKHLEAEWRAKLDEIDEKAEAEGSA